VSWLAHETGHLRIHSSGSTTLTTGTESRRNQPRAGRFGLGVLRGVGVDAKSRRETYLATGEYWVRERGKAVRSHARDSPEVVLLVLDGDRLRYLATRSFSRWKYVTAGFLGRVGDGRADRLERVPDRALVVDASTRTRVGKVRHAVRAHAAGVGEDSCALRRAAG
jgi:hypothetical protein